MIHDILGYIGVTIGFVGGSCFSLINVVRREQRARDLYDTLEYCRNMLSDYEVARRKGYVTEAWRRADAELERGRP